MLSYLNNLQVCRPPDFGLSFEADGWYDHFFKRHFHTVAVLRNGIFKSDQIKYFYVIVKQCRDCFTWFLWNSLFVKIFSLKKINDDSSRDMKVEFLCCYSIHIRVGHGCLQAYFTELFLSDPRNFRTYKTFMESVFKDMDFFLYFLNVWAC